MTHTPTPSVAFITPAYLRYELSKITFAQRAQAISAIRAEGFGADAIVIADDDNLLLARHHGFITVKSPNRHLSRKFNDGHQRAAREEFTHVVPVGSDTFLDPGWIIDALQHPEAISCQRNYSVVDQFGARRLQVFIPIKFGVHMCIPLSTLKRKNYRPMQETLMSGCDTATWTSASRFARTRFADQHPLEAVAFQSELQITSYDRLSRYWGQGETEEPYADLEKLYDPALIAQVRELHEKRREIITMKEVDRLLRREVVA